MSEPLCSPLVKTSTDDTATDPVINHLKSAGWGQPPKMYTESQLEAARAEGRREGLEEVTKLVVAASYREDGSRRCVCNGLEEAIRALADKGET